MKAVFFGFVFLGIFFGHTGTGNAQSQEVNIVFEANTTVPSFYQGRAEPTVGSTARATALLADLDGSAIYSYRWTVDGRVVGVVNGSKQSITIPINYDKDLVVRVEVIDQSGKTIASDMELLELSEPLIIFHEYNPLRGVSAHAIAEEFIIVGDQAQFRAEPYFMNVDTFSNNPLVEWRIDNELVSVPESDPPTLSIHRTRSGKGGVSISLLINNTEKLIQSARNKFIARF